MRDTMNVDEMSVTAENDELESLIFLTQGKVPNLINVYVAPQCVCSTPLPYIIVPYINAFILNFSEADNTKTIRCPCQLKVKYGPLIQCRSCKKYQHIYCFDMLQLEHAPVAHTCDSCAASDSSLSCTISGLQRLKALDRTVRTYFNTVSHLLQSSQAPIAAKSYGSILLARATFERKRSFRYFFITTYNL